MVYHETARRPGPSQGNLERRAGRGKPPAPRKGVVAGPPTGASSPRAALSSSSGEAEDDGT